MTRQRFDFSQSTDKALASMRRSGDEEIAAAEEQFIRVLARTSYRDTPHQAPAPKDDVAYTVTTISAHDVYGGERTVGIFRDWNEAVDCIRRNAMDLFETTYHLAVVEEVQLDAIYGGFERESWWFRWDREAWPQHKPKMSERITQGAYRDAECPESYSNVTGFGIG